MLADQVVTFEAGLPPPASNLSDSPMQAWTDSISSPDTASSKVDDANLVVFTAISSSDILVQGNELAILEKQCKQNVSSGLFD